MRERERERERERRNLGNLIDYKNNVQRTKYTEKVFFASWNVFLLNKPSKRDNFKKWEIFINYKQAEQCSGNKYTKINIFCILISIFSCDSDRQREREREIIFKGTKSTEINLLQSEIFVC